MSKFDEKLTELIKKHYHSPMSIKASRYFKEFYNKTKTTHQIKANVVGNNGEYIVTLKVKNGKIESACSCYIGKGGGCHHCEALAYHFWADPKSFRKITTPRRQNVMDLESLQKYLEGITLEDLISKMKKKGMTQTAFAESIGMSSRHLGAIKSAERRNRRFHELGATKLACLWVLENI